MEWFHETRKDRLRNDHAPTLGGPTLVRDIPHGRLYHAKTSHLGNIALEEIKNGVSMLNDSGYDCAGGSNP